MKPRAPDRSAASAGFARAISGEVSEGGSAPLRRVQRGELGIANLEEVAAQPNPVILYERRKAA